MAAEANKVIAAWRRWQGTNNNRRIFAAAALVGVLALIAKIGFFLKELVVAYHFGRSDLLDAYLIAYALPAFLVNVFASIYASALTPMFLSAWQQSSRDHAQRVLSGVLTLNFVLFLSICVVLWVFGQPIVKLLGPGFPFEKLAVTYEIFVWLVPCIIFGGTIACVGAVLNANERFYPAALSPLFTALTVTGSLVLFEERLGIYAIVFGILVGQLLELAYLWRESHLLNWRLVPGWAWSAEDRRRLFGQAGPLAGGVLLMCSIDVIDSAMASTLGSGGVSALSYGARLSIAIMGIGSIALGTVVLPKFSHLVVARDWGEIKRILRVYDRLIILVCLPLVGGIAFLSDAIVSIVYQRGAFTADDAQLVGDVLALHALHLPFYLMGILGGKAINAMAKNHWLFFITLATVTLKLICNYVFARTWGVAGIALATSVAVFFSWLIVRWLVNAELHRNLKAV